MINLTKNLFALWTRLFKQWLTQKFDSISIDITPVEDKINALDEKMTPYLYDECSVEEVNHMFETQVLDGYVFIPSNAINSNGTMPVSVFEAITDFTLE